MSTSTAILKYGTYIFADHGPIPQVGMRSNATPIGSNKSGPANRQKVVSLVGRVEGNNLNEVQTKVWALEAAFAKQDQTLYWHDGTTLRINRSAKVESIDLPAEWGQYEANFTITLTYWPLDDQNTPPFTVSFGAFTFNPIPILGKEFTAERETPDSARGVNRYVISLSGFIDNGSISANKTESDALEAALAADGTLTYDGLVQSVKVDNFHIDPDTFQNRIGYSIRFSYASGFTGAGSNVVKSSSSRQIGRVSRRSAIHYIPNVDDATVQLLGKNGQQIVATGFLIGTSMAAARTAAATEIAAQFPSAPVGVTMIEDPGSTVTEKSSENRVDWNVTKFYTAAVLTGGIYGS